MSWLSSLLLSTFGTRFRFCFLCLDLVTVIARNFDYSCLPAPAAVAFPLLAPHTAALIARVRSFKLLTNCLTLSGVFSQSAWLISSIKFG